MEEQAITVAITVVLIGLIIGVAVWLNREREKPGEPFHIRRYLAILAGNFQALDARYASGDEIKGAELIGRRGLLLGADFDTKKMLTYPGDQHLLLMSMARGGKFVNFIAPNLLYCSDRSMIVIDPKGQAAAVTARRRRELGQRVIFINPFGMHTGEPWNLQGEGFNPLAALDPESLDFVDRAFSITEALIQDSGKDSHWSDSARDILAAIIMHETIKQGQTTLGDVRTVLTMPESKRFEYVEGMTTCGFTAVEELAGRFLAQNNEIHGIFSEAITQTRFLTSPLIKKCLDRDDFRFEQLKEEKVTVYIIIPARFLKSQSRFLRLMVVSAIDAMMSSEKKQGDNSVLFVLDEFPSLGYLSSVEMAMGLAAGYGLQLWPIIQDFNQLKGIYGDKWETFLGNAGVKIIKGANDNFTAEYIGKMAGERSAPSESASVSEGSYFLEDEKNRTSNSTGNVSVSTIKRPLLSVPYLRGEWFVHGHVIFKAWMENPVPAFAEPYYRPGAWGEIFRGLFDPDPYHMPKEGEEQAGAGIAQDGGGVVVDTVTTAKAEPVLTLRDKMRAATK